MAIDKWRQEYNCYINSEEWQEKRDERLAISHYRCSACPSTTKLTVHHLTYRRVKNEDMADLLPLCVSCHEEIEGIIKEGKISRTGNPLWLATESVNIFAHEKPSIEVIAGGLGFSEAFLLNWRVWNP